MKYLFVFLLALPFGRPQAVAQSFPDSIQTILFLGNSITYAGMYVTDVEAALRLKYPGWKGSVINAGLPSETVSGLSEPGHAGGKFPRPDLHERLHRLLGIVQPDLVIACYGMNDGIYLPFDETRFEKYREGMTWLHDTLVKNAKRVIFLTPPVYDEQRGGAAGYAAVLDRYSRWLMSQSVLGWEIADVHTPMVEYLAAHRAIDDRFNIDGFALAGDGIHPGEAGHWLMAKVLLAYLGESWVTPYGSIRSLAGTFPAGTEILDLVEKRQAIMKDAWLTAAGHRRPGMKKGLPLDEAQREAGKITSTINTLQRSDIRKP